MTGNNLGQLALNQTMPTTEEIADFKSTESFKYLMNFEGEERMYQFHKAASEMLGNNNIRLALINPLLVFIMLNRLKSKWGVNNWNLFLIICTFALGGSLCGFLGRKILAFIGIEKASLGYVPAYLVTMSILWPFSVISVSLLTGQFSFFKNYLTKIFKRNLQEISPE